MFTSKLGFKDKELEGSAYSGKGKEESSLFGTHRLVSQSLCKIGNN